MSLWPSDAGARPWIEARAPRRVLAIRLHALGDLAITLPYLSEFHRRHGEPAIDLLTRDEYAELPRSVVLFRRVIALGGGRRFKPQVVRALVGMPRLLARRYEVVLDLQNNEISRTVRTLIGPRAWSTFDVTSPLSAGERTRRTIEAAGFSLPDVRTTLVLDRPDAGLEILRAAGWQPPQDLIVLSPAGAFPSRNWPIEHYAAFARQWRGGHAAQFVVLGLPSIHAKAAAIDAAAGGGILNLAGKTTISEALAILQRARLVVSEDCGLMHMAWVSGVPTLALFGSSRYDWSAPLGTHTRCLHSGDLPCGACMDPECRFGDVHCLTRYTPEILVAEAEALLARAPAERRCHPLPA